MATASKLVALAQAELGMCESPAGSNRQKYGAAYGLNGAPWCMIFIWWLFKQAGAEGLFYGGGKTASCTSLMKWAKSAGQWVTGGYRAGDIILYNFDNVSDADHCGICESASGNSVTCIEGNTSLTSDDNGGKVMRRKRSIGLVLGAYRPKYEAEVSASTVTGGTCEVTLNQLSKGSRGNSVKALQLILIGSGYSCGSYGADGDFGSATDSAVRKFQTDKGLSADGIVGVNTWTKLLK